MSFFAPLFFSFFCATSLTSWMVFAYFPPDAFATLSTGQASRLATHSNKCDENDGIFGAFCRFCWITEKVKWWRIFSFLSLIQFFVSFRWVPPWTVFLFIILLLRGYKIGKWIITSKKCFSVHWNKRRRKSRSTGFFFVSLTLFTSFLFHNSCRWFKTSNPCNKTLVPAEFRTKTIDTHIHIGKREETR